MSTNHLILELGTEELPPKALLTLSNAFADAIVDGLREASLIDKQSQSQVFATPRRLAVSISQVQAQQADQHVERRGPAIHAAFDKTGKPSAAALGFAKSCGVEIEQLGRLKTDKGEWLSYSVIEPGKSLTVILGDVLQQSVKQLPIPKRMRWGDKKDEFVRPVHWLLVLHGEQPVPVETLGVKAGQQSFGHRFHAPDAITLLRADEYQQTLREQGKVEVDVNQRRQQIEQQVKQLAASVDAQMPTDSALFDEVTALVEWPVCLLGEYDPRFLAVPWQCLVSSMRDHQKYFHLRNKQGELLPYFITVSNIESKDPQRVIDGNERVLRSRLSDAEFFWQKDLQCSLQSRLPQLENVLMHVKLGSLANKACRLQTLSGAIAEQIGAEVEIVQRAASLCKADLVTDMVGEFDELQGVMGRYYAEHDGEPTAVGECIEQHYWPRFAGDELPASANTQALSLADKIDTLVGLYAAGERATGDKDRYALRRAALALLRIIIDGELALSLSDLIEHAASGYRQQNIVVEQNVQHELIDFILGRLPAFYSSEGIEANAINAVMACQLDHPLDFNRRLRAVVDFGKLSEAADLAAVHKRIHNLLKKADNTDTLEIDAASFGEAAEHALLSAIENAENHSIPLFEQGKYTDGMKYLASLKKPIDDFFDQLMIMSDKPVEQRNRLALLARISNLFLRVADISLLAY